jgi:XTP/dITP diphosphohydrolase
MKKFIAATKNKGKIREISEILKNFPYDVLSMESIGINIDIEETGSTFEENALIKAKEINDITGEIVMADDSGLEVDYLNGAPGIYSARFAGEDATDEEKNIKLLDLLKNVPFEKRTARFVCVIAVAFPDGDSFTVKGTCEGYIASEPKGTNGFGYDPIFYVSQYRMTTAQMLSELKHEISHRGKALRLMVYELQKRFK